jgi:hypothetical protein
MPAAISAAQNSQPLIEAQDVFLEKGMIQKIAAVSHVHLRTTCFPFWRLSCLDSVKKKKEKTTILTFRKTSKRRIKRTYSS